MIGQSESVVPADRRMYALRDVTGTVESIPLITASIMSKKFAEGAQALLMDVKTGSGAFMKDRAQARSLAKSLVATGAGLGRKVAALITDMDQPLGLAIGNFLEVRECIECLQGRGPKDEVDLTVCQAGLDALPRRVSRRHPKRARPWRGSGWKTAARGSVSCGTSSSRAETPRSSSIPTGAAGVARKTPEGPRGGFVRRIDAYKAGVASVILGAGRSRKEDRVLPGVGITLSRTQGDSVARAATSSASSTAKMTARCRKRAS